MYNLLLLFIGNLNNLYLDILNLSIEINIINKLKSFNLHILYITNFKEEYNNDIFDVEHTIHDIKSKLELFNIKYTILYNELDNLNNIDIIISNYIHNIDYIIYIQNNFFFIKELKNELYIDLFKSNKIINIDNYNFILPQKYMYLLNDFISNNILDNISKILSKYLMIYDINKYFNYHIDKDKIICKASIIKKLISYTKFDLYNVDKLDIIYDNYINIIKLYNNHDDLINTLLNENSYTYNDFPENIKYLYTINKIKKTNICIIVYGQVRTFTDDVYKSWITNLINPLNDKYIYHFIFMFDLYDKYDWEKYKNNPKLNKKINIKQIESLILSLNIKSFNIIFNDNKNEEDMRIHNNIQIPMISNWISQVYKFYKLYHFSKLYENKHKIKFDYIIKLRPDLKLNKNIISFLNEDELNKYVLFTWDFCYIIPSHLFKIFFDTLYIMINSRFNDTIIPYTTKFMYGNKTHESLSLIEYHYIYIIHLLFYKIRSYQIYKWCEIIRPNI
jgi:hypothetical protein